MSESNEFNIKEVEKRWQDWWEKNEIYRFDPESDREPYTIDNPPRYASGALHIGHAVHYTHIDFIARYQRMLGKNVMFPLCFDVNGMPIEVNVEKKYGIKMNETDRHHFISLCKDFAENNIGTMKKQFKILGHSMDPSVYYQTDEPYYRRLTQVSFIRLFKEGLIYKDKFPVNWCPRCGTALAESEVEYKDRKTFLNYIHFKEKETGGPITIATTRPELLCTCQMVAIHPDDPRADRLGGKSLLVPMYDREVPIMLDDEVDADFGTGVVMICTIGDRDDLNWVFNYGLNMEMGIDENGLMTDLAGKYSGLHLEDAREAVIKDMKEAGLIVKQEPLDQNVGACWRCATPIEFILTSQWFLKTLDFKLDVLEASDSMKWFPSFMRTRLEEWVNRLNWDWVISRQRYFGTPIPAWECHECKHIEVPDEEECYIDLTLEGLTERDCSSCGGVMKGSVEVFDTWMDSSLTPLYNSYWLRNEDYFNKVFPMSLRPQSHDIIRTWAFYSILRSKLLTGDKPFKTIMMDGFILSADGTPMHASKGNVIDPLEILDEFGADPLRFYASNCALGKDNPYRHQDVLRGLSVSRKLFNIGRLVKTAIDKGFDNSIDIANIAFEEVESDLHDVDRWLISKYSKMVGNATDNMEKFRFDHLVKDIINFTWHKLADHYLEISKNRIYSGNDKALLFTLYNVMKGILKMLAPFLCHITEDIYQNIFAGETKGNSIHVSSWPEPINIDDDGEALGDLVVDITSAVRSYKSEKKIPLNASIGELIIGGALGRRIQDSIEDIIAPTSSSGIQFADELLIEKNITGLKPNFSVMGPRFKNRVNDIVKSLIKLNPASLWADIDKKGIYSLKLDDEEFFIDKKCIIFERGMSIKGQTVEAIESPNEDISIFIKN